MKANALRDAVDIYCNKYCIAPAFQICDLFDIENPTDWDKDWPFGDHSGCYAFYCKNGGLLYVGKADTLRSRVQQYFVTDETRKCGIAKNWGWSAPPRFVQTIRANEIYEAPSLEAYLIGRLHPTDNQHYRIFSDMTGGC